MERQDDEDGVPLENHMLTKVASAKEIRRTKDVLCTPIVLGESWRNFLAELLVNAPVLCAQKVGQAFSAIMVQAIVFTFSDSPFDFGCFALRMPSTVRP